MISKPAGSSRSCGSTTRSCSLRQARTRYEANRAVHPPLGDAREQPKPGAAGAAGQRHGVVQGNRESGNTKDHTAAALWGGLPGWSLQGHQGHLRNRSGGGAVSVERRLGTDHPDQTAAGGGPAKEARRVLGQRAEQWVHDVLSVAGARRERLLGRRAGSLLPIGEERGARRQQMGLRPIGGLHKEGRKPVGVRRWLTTSGPSAGRAAPTSFFSTHSSVFISPTDGPSAPGRRSQRTG